MKTRTKDSTKPITRICFRLPPGIAAKLARRASRRKLSVHEYARQAMLDSLTLRQTVQALANELGQVRKDLAGMRKALGQATIAMLVDGGKVENEEDAKDWVRQNLFQ